MTQLVDLPSWEDGYRRSSPEPRPITADREWTRSYHGYLLHECLYPRVLPDLRGQRLIELGSAPGRHLAELSRRLGVEPFGVERTAGGVARNREVFEQNGLNPANVLHADFLSPEFQHTHRETFDVVLSRGLIEHFVTPREVIGKHLTLLRDGGWLIVIVPNMRGLYGAWLRRFHPKLLERQNLEVMRLGAFRALFQLPGLEQRWCGHLGTFDSYAFRAAHDSSVAIHVLVRWLHRLQLPLNACFRLVLGTRGFETSVCSPFLVYIGQKHEMAGSADRGSLD